MDTQPAKSQPFQAVTQNSITLPNSAPTYQAEPGEPLILGDLTVYPETYEAYQDSQRIALRRKEYQLLEFLIRHKNKVLNRHTLLEYIWNYDTQAITNTLDVHISSLRKKIKGKNGQTMIHTIYGAGYKMSDQR